MPLSTSVVLLTFLPARRPSLLGNIRKHFLIHQKIPEPFKIYYSIIHPPLIGRIQCIWKLEQRLANLTKSLLLSTSNLIFQKCIVFSDFFPFILTEHNQSHELIICLRFNKNPVLYSSIISYSYNFLYSFLFFPFLKYFGSLIISFLSDASLKCRYNCLSTRNEFFALFVHLKAESS